MIKSLVCDIQRFSVHDGPGIRTTVFFKGCPLRCKWCQNPETLKFDNELVFSYEKCIACGDCAKACPNNAIRFENVPITDWQSCKACFTCNDVCPSLAREPAAKEYTASELVAEIVKDREFYGSEGGVTLSGGEPFARHAFLLELLPILKEEKIHTAAQTCGYFNSEAIEPVLDMIDMVIFDLKAVTPELHRKLTGKDNKLILENLRNIIEREIPHQIRMPIVPGLNDAEDELKNVARLLLELKETEIWIIPYHRMGESKLKKMNTELKPLDITPPGEKEIKKWADIFSSSGLQVVGTHGSAHPLSQRFSSDFQA